MLLALLAACHDDPPPPPDTGTPPDGAFLGRGISLAPGSMWVTAPAVDGGGSVVRFDGLSPDPAAAIAAAEPGQIGDAVARCGDLLLVGAPDLGDGGGTWWFDGPDAPRAVTDGELVEGTQDEGRAGAMVACGSGGDLVAVAAPDAPGIGLAHESGDIELFDGGGGRVASIRSTWDQSHLGHQSAVLLHDLDGDGVDDLVAGGYGADQLNVWIAPIAGTTDTNEALTFTGIPNEGAGWSVAAGDLDGDGHADLVFGAPLAAGGRGAVWMVLGPLDGGDHKLTAYAPAHEVPGAGAGDEAGSSVAVAGDVDGDGAEDWLVGAPGSVDGAGAVYLVRGPGNVLDTLDHADAVMIASDPGGRLGWAVGGADLDGDGAIDLVATAPETDVGAVRSAGSVFVFPGSTAGRVYTEQARTRIDGT